MATCEDCLHDKLCSFYEDECGIRWNDNQPKCALEHIEKHCTQFKDRSRFVELPCEVGTEVFVVENGQIIPDVVDNFTIQNFIEGEPIYEGEGYKTSWEFKDFGKCVFVDPKKAEKALKERNNG